MGNKIDLRVEKGFAGVSPLDTRLALQDRLRLNPMTAVPLGKNDQLHDEVLSWP